MRFSEQFGILAPVIQRVTALLAAALLAGCVASTARPDLDSLGSAGSKKHSGHDKEERVVNYFDAATILKKADAFYSDGEWADASAEYGRFVELHRLHSQAGYALYRLGMSDFKQVSTMDRDQEPLLKAQAAFERLLSEFPDSLYAAEAKVKVADGRRMQAERLVTTGRFYYRQGRLPAAIVRLRRAAEDFADVDIQAAEALYYLARAYREAGQAQEARAALTALLDQYPRDRHYARARRTLTELTATP